MLYPTAPDEASQVRLTVCCVACVPVPVRLSSAGEFEALLTKDIVPEVAPLACGENVTVKVADCPEAKVTGNEMPERANSLLVELAEVTVTEAPLAVMLPFIAECDPTVTLPKARVDGDTASVPAAAPVPVSAMLSGEFDAFDTTDKVPLAAPLAVGAKVAVKVTL